MTKQAFILAGPTGAGKSVQAHALMERHPDWCHISSGDLLRADPAAAPYLSRGELAPDAEIERLMALALAEASKAEMIFFDGFPRNLVEAHWLEKQLDDQSRKLKLVVVLEVAQATIFKRVKHRGRSDDNLTAMKMKRHEYETAVIPTINYYQQHRLVLALDGTLPIETITRQIEEALRV